MDNNDKPPESKPDPYDLIERKHSQSYDDDCVSKVHSRTEVGKPNSQKWFMVDSRPGYTLNASIVEQQIEGEIGKDVYFVCDSVVPLLSRHVKQATIHVLVTRTGVAYLYPLKEPGEGKNSSRWAEDAAVAMEEGKAEYVQMVKNLNASGYDIKVAKKGLWAPPPWPEKSLKELIKQGFPRDRIVAGKSHPLVIELTGSDE